MFGSDTIRLYVCVCMAIQNQAKTQKYAIKTHSAVLRDRVHDHYLFGDCDKSNTSDAKWKFSHGRGSAVRKIHTNTVSLLH